MKIIPYSPKYAEDVKDLLVELQQHLSDLDKRGVLTLKQNYREDYFAYVLSETEKNDGRIFLAESGGRAVGVIVCKIFQGGEGELTTTCPKIGFINDLSVTRSERGRGIGKSLVSEAEKYFASKGCEYTQLEVFAPNARAAELYKKLGFETLCLYMSKKCNKN